jgi:ABC-2 type transport system permease protein
MSRWRAIRLVAMREIIERGRSRGYVLSLVFTLFLIGAGFILPSLLLGNDATEIGIVEPAPPALKGAVELTAATYGVEVEVTSVPDRAAAEAALEDGSLDAVLVVPQDLSGPGELVVHERASDEVQAIATGAVIQLRAAQAAPLLVPPVIVALEPPADSDLTALIFANAGIIIMFIGIFSYGTWVLTGVVEEKQSRVVEVVLSTVRPRDLLMGKVIGIGLLALVQLLVIVAAGIAFAVVSGRLVLPPTTVGAVVMLTIWFLLGFGFYATAMGFLGSLASRIEEASNASMPVTMTATACYLASILLVTQDPDGVLAMVLTFFPPAAPMVVPLRAALDAITPLEIGLSIALMLAAIWILFVIGARVYAGAVLQTGGRIRIRDAWRART